VTPTVPTLVRLEMDPEGGDEEEPDPLGDPVVIVAEVTRVVVGAAVGPGAGLDGSGGVSVVEVAVPVEPEGLGVGERPHWVAAAVTPFW
jgi:hypothetical protein